MQQEYVSAISVFLIAYSSFLSAYILIGQNKTESLYWSVIPALAVLGFHVVNITFVVYALAAFVAITSFFIAFKLSKRNGCVSAVAVLIAFSFCLSGKLVYGVLCTRAWMALTEGAVGLLFSAVLWIFKINIFPEDYILTKEQKKTMLTRRFYLFPGLVLLIAWQLIFASVINEHKLILLVYTLLFQLVVLLLLRQQVRGMQERIENIIDKQYQSELLNFMQVIRSQRHDFNFHMQTIFGMIESGQYDECKSYLQSMMSTVQSTNDVLPLHHPATSALLNTFREMALQKGLRMDIEIHDNLQFVCTTVYETNTILGNLLQNAIDELELHPENEMRTIKVLIIKRGQYNIIKVSNQCHLAPDEMSRAFMPGYTTKTSHEGLGLANALRIAEKYDGTVYPEFEGSIVHFIARLPMK